MNAPQVYQTATKLPSIFCAGHAQENTAKAEDVWDVTNGKKMSIAAVFDGHGGKMAAHAWSAERPADPVRMYTLCISFVHL